jgi:chorismate dehydratase
MTLRVGRIKALNMYPLYHHLEAAGGDNIQFTDGVPTTLNRALVEGDLDVSAMSSIEFARNSDVLRIVPVASISAEGAVDSIQVFSRVPFAEVRSVALTPDSATSVALLRVLIGPAPTFAVLDESPADALDDVDAVLLIGDEALQGLRAPFAPHHTDLGQMWREASGLPMVFAVWAARRDLSAGQKGVLSELSVLLTEAQRRYAADPESVIDAAAQRFPFPRDFIAAYLQRLSYGFGAAERAGLSRFLELAHAAGEVHELPILAA